MPDIPRRRLSGTGCLAYILASLSGPLVGTTLSVFPFKRFVAVGKVHQSFNQADDFEYRRNHEGPAQEYIHD